MPDIEIFDQPAVFVGKNREGSLRAFCHRFGFFDRIDAGGEDANLVPVKCFFVFLQLDQLRAAVRSPYPPVHDDQRKRIFRNLIANIDRIALRRGQRDLSKLFDRALLLLCFWRLACA